MCGIDHKAARVNKSPLNRENGGTKTTLISSLPDDDDDINLDHGDPIIFEQYWREMDEKCSIFIPGYQSLSYFSNSKSLCWFLEPKLEEEIRRLHNVVGNAKVEDYHIVVGTGSTQLIQAALYALCPPNKSAPVSVVSTAPYYSCYPEATDYLNSRLYKWAGDAYSFNENGPYIEFVTSPNNPDGTTREATVRKNGKGKLVHDLAYYWPQYTSISTCANYDIMLFTFSKCTGHAGSRIGWALVKDENVARRMTKFIEINTIGVSKEPQIRATKILRVISDSPNFDSNNFFEYTRSLIIERWEMLREVISRNEIFSLPEYPHNYCFFSGEFSQTYPAFAWIKCEKNEEDLEKILLKHKILTRSGKRFGSDQNHVRVSMVGNKDEFKLFLDRLLVIQENSNPKEI